MEQGVLAGVSGRRTRPVRSGRYPELCSAGVSRCSPHSSSPGCSEGRGPELVESGSCQTAQRIVPSPLHSVRARVGSRHTSLRSHRRTRGTKRRKKYVELSVFARRIGTRFGAMAQFIDHNRTERDVGDFRRAPAGDQLGLSLPEQRNAGVGVRKVDHSSGSRSSNSPCDPRRRPGIEPATRSKNPIGQPFSSTVPVVTGVTVTTTSTSASTTSTSTLRFSLPSFVVRARVSTVLLSRTAMYSNRQRRSSASPH